MKSEEPAHGGKRPGAGRPKGSTGAPYVKCNLNMSPEAVEKLDQLSKDLKMPRGRVVEKLILEA